MNKLNIGCGLDFQEGYLNIDIQDLSETCPKGYQFRQSECNKLSFIMDRSIEEVYVNQLCEHIHPLDIKETLAEWRRVLKIGGILRIVFPDFDKVIEHYQECKELKTTEDFMNFLTLNYVTLCSTQGTRVNTLYPHKSLLTVKFVSVLLESEGFEIATVNNSSERRYSTEIVAKRVLKD